MYTVFDEMSMSVLLETTDLKQAREMAYNHQCVLKKDGKVIHDYSCDY